jgi:purine-binding chemotaxis protein CheW
MNQIIEAKDMTDNATNIHEDRMMQYVTFRLAGQTFGINVMKVQEVLRYSCVNTLPSAPEYD